MVRMVTRRLQFQLTPQVLLGKLPTFSLTAYDAPNILLKTIGADSPFHWALPRYGWQAMSKRISKQPESAPKAYVPLGEKSSQQHSRIP